MVVWKAATARLEKRSSGRWLPGLDVVKALPQVFLRQVAGGAEEDLAAMEGDYCVCGRLEE